MMSQPPPGGCVQVVWSLKPRKERGDTGSPVPPIASLDVKSNKMGCHTATGMTSLISEMFMNRRCGSSNRFSDSSLEAAECHTFRFM